MKQVLSLLGRLWKKPITRIVTSVLILAFLFVKLPLADLWATVTQLSPGVWVLAVLLFVVGHVVGVVKWNLLINVGTRKIPFTVAFRYYFAGLFANLFLPSIAGGDVIRAGMAIQYSKEKEAVILGSLTDRFLDVCSLGLFIVIGVLLSPIVLSSGDRSLLLWLIVMLTGAVVVGVLFLVMPLPKRLPERFASVIARVRDILRRLVKNPQRALAALGLSFTIQGTFVLLNAFIGAAMGLTPGLAVWFFAWPLAKISAMLPISIGGLGVREAALAVLLGRFGVPMAGAVGLGLLWQTVLLTGGALGGLFYYIGSRRAPSRERFLSVAGSVKEDAPA